MTKAAMDATDLQILRSLAWRPDDPTDARRGVTGPWDIAKDLGLHGTTIKRRIAAMQEAGVLSSIRLLPNFRLLGIRGALFLFSYADSSAKRRAFEWMNRHTKPGGPHLLARIEAFVGNRLMAAVTVPADAEPETEAAVVGDATQASSWQCLEHEAWPMDGAVTELDMRLMMPLLEDALMTPPQLAEAAGVTPKTVRARLARLAASKAFQIVPAMAPSKMQGIIPAMIVVEPEGDSAASMLFNSFPDAFLRSHPNALLPYVYIGAKDSATLDERLRVAEDLRVVRRAELLLFEASQPCVEMGAHMPPLGRYIVEGRSSRS